MGIGIGVALFFAAFVGTATAQPAFPNTGAVRQQLPGPSELFPVTAQSGPAFPSSASAMAPPSAPAATSFDSIQTIAAQGDELPPVKELPGLPELVPPPNGGHGENHEISPFLTPFVPAHRGWYTSGEFLLMRARDTNFDYALIGANNTLGTIGPTESLKYNIGTGLNAELGYRFGEGKWDMGFSYTYITDGANNYLTAAPGQVIFPTLTRPGLTDRVNVADAHANLDYQLYDLIVARRTVVDEHFAIRWIGGFRFTDIRESYFVNYDGLDARGASVRSSSQFRGFGPIFGGEAVLVGWRGFHLYTRAIGGLISGNNTNRVFESNDSGQTTYVNTSYDIRKVVPTGTIALGGGWQYRTIAFRAGYQISIWQGIFERPRFTDDVAQGAINTRPSDLTLEGLFIQMSLTF